MTSPMRRIARAITPTGLMEYAGRRHATRFDDSCATWADAVRATDATDWSEVADRVVAAMAEARAGRAAFERDGVAVQVPDVRWPVLSLLQRQALRDGGRLRVLDFGGSLGSFYWQHADHFAGLDIQWAVVEQSVFVTRARTEDLGPVTMHETIADAVAHVAPTVVLLSSVLQYLADPHDTLRQSCETGAGCVIIDRTTVTDLPNDRPAIQTVPDSLYRASYPAWLLSEQRLASTVPGWRVTATFPGIEPNAISRKGVPIRWRGCALEPQ
jgi:putative methyltransferase (TIGR04325 family)